MSLYGAALSTVNAFAFGAMHFFAATYDGQDFRLYVDGSPAGVTHQVGTINDGLATDRWILGAPGLGLASPYHAVGQYHEVGFDNSVYSAAKIAAMWASKP